jgi:hypothetical protein
MTKRTQRLPTDPTTGQPRWPQRPNHAPKRSRSPNSPADYTAKSTHTTWDNPGCLFPHKPKTVSGIFSVGLLDKDS